ncbi:MAG: hypothetical protein JKY67_00465, partial [Pseudomonadales bacterium]|nr:hypothetical protein [Pseudomonadales bacterium]
VVFKNYIVLLFLAFSLASCGGSGGSGGSGSDDRGVGEGITGFPQIAEDTQWLLIFTPTSDSCDDSEQAFFNLNIAFDSTDNSATAELEIGFGESAPLAVNSANATSIVMSGSYSEDDETVTLSNTILNFDGGSDVSTFSGTVDWKWQDSEDTCTGTADLSGTLTSSSGPIVDL